MPNATPVTATSLHLAVRPEWLERRHEEIIEPELPIVDPHHHLVERPETGRYLLPDLLADTSSGHNITATVYPRMAIDVSSVRSCGATAGRRNRVRQRHRGDER